MIDVLHFLMFVHLCECACVRVFPGPNVDYPSSRTGCLGGRSSSLLRQSPVSTKRTVAETMLASRVR